MVKVTQNDVSRFNGKFLAPGIVIIRPSVRQYLTTNSLLFVDETNLLIDAGFQHNSRQLQTLKETIEPDIVLFSHYHLDHVFGSHIFKESRKIIHNSEMKSFSSLESFLNFCYFNTPIPKEMLKNWNEQLHFFLSLENLSNWQELALDKVESFRSTDSVDLGKLQLQILHIPGHSPGHCGIFEPTNKILLIGDLDISRALFAWYGWKNADLAQFRQSVLVVKEFIEENDVSIIVPSHSKPVSKIEGLQRLEKLYNVFDNRKNQILDFISKNKNGTTLTVLAKQSFIYQGKKSDPPFIWELFEKIHIEKHVEELVNEGEVAYEGNLIVQVVS
jgi:glyoxylase-like metal-dependent hydrolase (beta-lactamase superfamily II)